MTSSSSSLIFELKTFGRLSLHFVRFSQRIAFGEQGWRSGESARLPQCGPGLTPGPGVICGLSLLLVLVLAPRGFSPGTRVFPSPQKPIHPNSNSIAEVSPNSNLC